MPLMQDNTRYVVNTSFRKLFLPTLGSNSADILTSVIEAALVGHFCGTAALAIYTLLLALESLWAGAYEGLGVGTTALFTQHLGAQEKEKAMDSVAQSNTLMLLYAVLLTVIFAPMTLLLNPNLVEVPAEVIDREMGFVYLKVASTLPVMARYYLLFLLRADNAPRFTTFVSGLTIAVNLILDVVLMGWLNWGLFGAAVAHLTSMLVAIVFLVGYIVSGRTTVRLSFRWPKAGHVKSMMPFMANAMAENMAEVVSMLVADVLVLNAFGIEVASIFFVFGYIVTFNAAISISICYTVGPILGVFYGARDPQAMKLTSRKAIGYGIAMTGVLTLLVMLFPQQIAVYGFSYEFTSHYELCATALRILSISLVPLTLIYIITTLYQQSGHEKLALYITVFHAVLTFVLYVASALGKVSWLLWLVPPISEITTLGLSMLWAKYKLRRDSNLQSLLLLEKAPDDFVAETYYLILSDHYDEVEDYQTMAKLFLSKWGVDEDRANKVSLTLEELLNLGTLTRSRSYISIRIGVTADRDVSVHAMMDNDITNMQALTRRQAGLDDDDANLCLLMLRSIDPEVNYENMLSMSTVDLKV